MLTLSENLVNITQLLSQNTTIICFRTKMTSPNRSLFCFQKYKDKTSSYIPPQQTFCYFKLTKLFQEPNTNHRMHSKHPQYRKANVENIQRRRSYRHGRCPFSYLCSFIVNSNGSIDYWGCPFAHTNAPSLPKKQKSWINIFSLSLKTFIIPKLFTLIHTDMLYTPV